MSAFLKVKPDFFTKIGNRGHMFKKFGVQSLKLVGKASSKKLDFRN